jgi:hypothetical protein
MRGQYARSFARHETFHPRYGWLRKAVRGAAANPAIFLEPDAIVRLGVGKNMVRAIRYWGLAFGLIDEAVLPDRPRLTGVSPTRLGAFLMGDKPADPYLEDPASLWLLHWQLLRRGSLAPSWYLAFNRFPQREFADAELTGWLKRELDVDGIADIALGSLEKDVSCLLRMYGPTPAAARETTLASPFSTLRLLDRLAGRTARYRITYGPKTGLPPELIVISALGLMLESAPDRRSIGLAELATHERAPGKVFALAEDELADAIERAASRVSGFELSVHAGMRRLAIAMDPTRLSNQLFQSIYGQSAPQFGLADLGTPQEAAAA